MSSIEVFVILSVRPLNFAVMSRRKRAARLFDKRIKGSVVHFTPSVNGCSRNSEFTNRGKYGISLRIKYNRLTKAEFLC